MKWCDVEAIARRGESEFVELKKSTAQLQRACETLCGMLNGGGGTVLVGVTPEGRVLGQEISDKTLRDVAGMLQRFDLLGY